MAGRGDGFGPFLLAALGARYALVGEVDAELSQVQRLMSAVVTFRPSRRAWVERFYKSELSAWLRSRNAAKALRGIGERFEVVFQIHALFEVADPRTVIYIDCTHRQSAQQWPDWNPLRGAALRRWYKRERRQYRAARHLFAFSDETRVCLVDDYKVAPERVTVVGAGLNFEDLPSEVGPRPAELPPTVLFVGNDFVRKGGPQLLEAFAIVRQRVPQARLRIVGTPHAIAPQPGVEVIGRVQDREEMSALYAAAHVMCLPSTFEPYGFVLLEAMAHSLPCVTTRSCGIPEIVLDGVTGTLVGWDKNPARTGPASTATDAAGDEPPDVPAVDVDELADALSHLLTEPATAARMGAAGRQRVTDHMLWSHVVDRMAPVLDQLHAHPDPRGAGRGPSPRASTRSGSAS